MSKRVKFVLRRGNFRDQVLKGSGTQNMLRERLGQDSVGEESADRVRARVYGKMSSEAKDGVLSRRLGRV